MVVNEAKLWELARKMLAAEGDALVAIENKIVELFARKKRLIAEDELTTFDAVLRWADLANSAMDLVIARRLPDLFDGSVKLDDPDFIPTICSGMRHAVKRLVSAENVGSEMRCNHDLAQAWIKEREHEPDRGAFLRRMSDYELVERSPAYYDQGIASVIARDSLEHLCKQLKTMEKLAILSWFDEISLKEFADEHGMTVDMAKWWRKEGFYWLDYRLENFGVDAETELAAEVQPVRSRDGAGNYWLGA